MTVPVAYSATETFTYDANGNLKTWTDANGTTITHTYDIRNRLTNKSYASSQAVGRSGNADGLNNIAFSYDANGNVTQSTETYAATPADATVTPPLEAIAASTRTHTKRYDSFNRLDKETDPWGNSLSHSYDAQGNLKATTATTVGTANTVTTRTASYQYDVLNRRVSTTAGGAATTIAYDRSSLPVKITYGNGAVSTTEYDSAGRVTSVSHTIGGTPIETTTYTYDGNGNRKTEAVTQFADSTGNNAQPPETRTTTYSYDGDDRLTSTTASVISTLNAANGATLADIAAATAEAASRSYSVAYSYDAAGNRVSEVATSAGSGAGGATNPAAAAPTYSKTYTLNPRNQVTQIVQTGGTGSATNYGATAQPTVAGGGGGTATSGNSGTNTVITPPLLVQTNGTTTLQYDGNGNLTQKVFVPATAPATAPATGGATPTGPPGSGVTAAPVATTTQYRWNVRDGLSLVTVAITGQPQTAVGQYRYTPEGLRDVKRAVNESASGSSTYLVERRSLWRMGAGSGAGAGQGAADFAYLDTDADNNLLGQYESHPNGRSALQRIDGAGQTTYLHTDALGSQTHTSGGGAGGTLTSTTQYDAFGNVVTQSGYGASNGNLSYDSKFGYTGHEADAESGLVYFKARYYDPQLGRFIGADAFEGDAGSPMSWNGYAYARGNPFMYIDEDGNIDILASGSEKLNDFGNWLKGQTKALGNSPLDKIAAVTIGAARAVVALGEVGLDGVNAAANSVSVGLGRAGLNSKENIDAHTAELDRTFATLDNIGGALGSSAGRGKLYQGAKDTFGDAVYDGDTAAIGDLSTAIFGTVGGPKSGGGGAITNSAKAAGAVVRDVGATVVIASVAVAKDIASTAVASGKNYLAARAMTNTLNALEQAAPSSAIRAEAQIAVSAAGKIAEGAPILLQEGGGIGIAAAPTVTQSVVAKLGTADEAVVRGVNNAVVNPLRAGQLHEAEQLATLGINKNNAVFRPTIEQTDTATFKAIVGEPKYTRGGQLKGTIFDGVDNGYLEIKGGSSDLISTYQLRLQTYKATIDRQPFSVQTTRPVNPQFQNYLNAWGVNVVKPK